MDIMTLDGANKRFTRAFTLVEAVMTIAILAVTMTTMATIIRYSDNSAMQARLDSMGMLEFAKQTQWLVNVPMSSFRESLNAHGGTLPLTLTVDKESEAGAALGLLYDPASYFLMQNSDGGAFPYTLVLTVESREELGVDAATYFDVAVNMVYNPPTLFDQSPEDPELQKEFNFSFEKW